MTLKTYAVVLELVRRLAPLLPVLRARSGALGDQFERALTSIPLNTAEGAYSRGKTRQARYRSAAASAREALACWKPRRHWAGSGPLEPELLDLFDRVIGTLVRLLEPQALSQTLEGHTVRLWPSRFGGLSSVAAGWTLRFTPRSRRRRASLA